MAELYRARMTAAAGVTRPVVIKKILSHYAGNAAFVSMFINEARIAVGLSHGNIAQVFDFGEVDGEYYLAMEWVHGQPLSRVLRRAREKGFAVLPVPLALLVAIGDAQGAGLRARPGWTRAGGRSTSSTGTSARRTCCSSYEGQVKLVDFGIARARLAGRVTPEADASQGKYLYFSPEQARGRELDVRADIFAAGAVLYEMLCGKLPWQGERLDVLQRISRGDFPPPRAPTRACRASWSAFCAPALAVEREQRYPTAQAFGEALQTYLHTAVPDFSASALAHFLAYLFESELVAEGRPVRLPPDFLGQLDQWSRSPPEAPPPPPSRPSQPQLIVPPLPPPESPEPRRRRPLQALAMFGVPIARGARSHHAHPHRRGHQDVRRGAHLHAPGRLGLGGWPAAAGPHPRAHSPPLG